MDILYKANGSFYPVFQTGYVTTNGAAGTTRSYDVSFPKKFRLAPQIFLTANTASPQNANVGCTQVTTSGFKLHMRYATDTEIPVRWLAIA